MKFKKPIASRKRLEQLLEYLGDTRNYSTCYSGNRAEDFKKCFDTESKWCWIYADLVLRGMEKRHLQYAERHHIVPRSFYGKKHRRDSKELCRGNMTRLTYGEHVYAHYSLAKCARKNMLEKMAIAFYMMYGNESKCSDKILPDDSVLIESIPEMEVNRIRSIDRNVSRLDAEGRTHYYEDFDKAVKEANRTYYEKNKRRHNKKSTEYYRSHEEEIKSRNKTRYQNNEAGVRDAALMRSSKYRLENPEKVKEQRRRYYMEHADEIKEKTRKWEAENPGRKRETARRWRHDNQEKAREHSRKWKRENHEKVLAAGKDYRERKIAAGWRIRLDPATGKRHWMFVGLPGKSEAA